MNTDGGDFEKNKSGYWYRRPPVPDSQPVLATLVM